MTRPNLAKLLTRDWSLVTQFQLRHAVLALVVRRVYTVFIHSFVYLHISKTLFTVKCTYRTTKLHMQR